MVFITLVPDPRLSIPLFICPFIHSSIQRVFIEDLLCTRE